MRTHVADEQILAGAAATLTASFRDQDGDLADPAGTVTVKVAQADGTVLLTREDVGRHNAVDKVVGRMLLDGQLPATGLGLFVSGRASFELVQKAWAAGFATLVAVSAPTSLAVLTARRAGLRLVGFAREHRLNVYSPERIGDDPRWGSLGAEA